jgi:hypothetical protein
MTSDGIAFVLTSSNERGGVPSAKEAFAIWDHLIWRTSV